MTDQEYIYDHIHYLKGKAARTVPVAYMDATQTEDFQCRERHVGWLIEKARHLGMTHKGAQLSIVYFDHYMGHKKMAFKGVELGKYGALFIAYMIDQGKELKAEEINELTNKKYTVDEVLLVRNYLMAILRYQFDRSTASEIIWFLCERTDSKFIFHYKQAELLSELCYLKYDIVLYGPLVFSIAACAYSFELLGSEELKKKMLDYASEYFEVSIKDVESAIFLIKSY